jgi:peptidoglycan/LPS O-acetylase OafA/YrhL
MFWGDFSAGILRAGYSFGAGLLLVGARRQTKSSNLGSTGLLFFAGCLLVMPSWGAFNPFYDMAVVLVFFPAVVFAASQVQPTGRWVALFAALGKSSYGIYILQVPVSALVAIGFTEIFHAKIGSGAPLVLLPCLFAAALALDKAYDRPLRRLLGRLKFF